MASTGSARKEGLVQHCLKSQVDANLHRYPAEFPYRFNRRFDLSDILVRLIRAPPSLRPTLNGLFARLNIVTNKVTLSLARIMTMLTVFDLLTKKIMQ